MSGPLASLRVVEFAGLGPTPFSAMMLADMGAQVLRIHRRDDAAISPGDPRLDFLNRSRPSIALDLKSEAGVALARELVAEADVLLEGFRPGVMERLGLGPADVHPSNPRLVYARMTGWGQDGPLARTAGHDINYLALTGALQMLGEHDRPPPPPLNLVGNYGGGGMLMVAGILAALVERQSSGSGQVIDAAIVDGASLLATQIFAWTAMGFWRPERQANLLDGGAYFYRCYETGDGKYMALGAIEPQFHEAMLRALDLDPAEFPDQLNPAYWPERAARLEQLFRTRTRDEWVDRFAPFDACATPVLSPEEATRHPVNLARNSHFPTAAGAQPAPAPRFSRTPSEIGAPPGMPGEGGGARLAEWGLDRERLEGLAKAGVIAAT